ncbi:hypothetical protein BH23CHL2_BH23CHL2_07570 [soil metagenome]
MTRTALVLLTLALLLASCGGPEAGTPAPTAPSNPGSAAGRPVILVPGVAGTQLVGGEMEVWAAVSDQILSPTDEFLLALGLDVDGTAGDTGVTHGDILRRAAIEIAGVNVRKADFYGTIIDRFESAGYREEEMLFVFPYDWRIDGNVEAARLRAFIDEVRDRTGAEQVDIVAHSMGGLVALDALQDTSMVGKVSRLVTLGTPVLGATKALGVLEFKALCFTEEILNRHCITNPTTAQRVMTNFPTAYQLLPSRAFGHAVGSPLEIEGVESGYDEWSGIVRSNRNPALLDAAINWQSQLAVRPNDPGVEMLRVAGSDQATPVQIERFTIHDCFLFTAPICPEKTVNKIIAGPGDGTVPRASASLHDPVRGFDQREDVPIHYVAGVSHMGLAQDSDIFAEVLAFLRGETEGRAASSAGLSFSALAINDDPEPFDGMTVTVIGPAWGTVESEADERTGPVADNQPDVAYEGIPGSEYWRSGSAQTFAFSRAGSHFAQFTVPPTDSEEYRYLQESAAPDDLISNVILIEIDRYRESSIEDRAIFRVEPTDGMRLEFSFDTRGDPDDVEIFIDRDGDDQYDGEAVEVDNREPLQVDDDGTGTATPTETPAPEPVVRQLLQLGPDNQLLPDLITGWEISDNGDLIVVEIEQDVTLADGSPLVSETLIEIIEEQREEFIEYEYLGSRPVDDYTVTIVLGTTGGEEFLIEIAAIEIVVLE